MSAAHGAGLTHPTRCCLSSKGKRTFADFAELLFADAASGRAARRCEAVLPDQRIIMITTMTATMIATMMMTIKGLFTMCRSMPKRAPSGSKSMPHFGHFPGFD